MRIEVNGNRLWFDVVGASLDPVGPDLRPRPTLLVVHGGPAGYDHSYLRPHLDRLAGLAQVVYVDLLHALRHPGHPSGLLLQATAGRHDTVRVVEGFRSRFGDELAAIASRVFRGGTTSVEERRRVLDAFGPNRPDDDAYARILPNPDLEAATSDVARFDVVPELHRIDVPVLVTVGDLDPVTPVAAARELSEGVGRASCHLEVLDGVGHFPWLDDPDRYWRHVERFIASCSRQPTVSPAGRSDRAGTGSPDPSVA